MKEIKAIIQPFMLEKVTTALHAVGGLPAITVTSALGIAVERGSYDQVAKTKLEMMVPDSLVDKVVQVIQQHAHTGQPGDGRIFVIPIEQTVKIRTGERDTHQ